MKCPLLIGGNEILRSSFTGTSPFYPDYTYPVANAGMLEVAEAIGRARRAERASRESRASWLRKAADVFTYQEEDLEHAVHVTGMPITQIKTLFEEIPYWLRQIPAIMESRLSATRIENGFLVEEISPGLQKILLPMEGYCYVATPGNDPRAAALVAANLCYLGIPFIIKASNKDALAPRVLKSLIQAGFDPNFCSLLYFESRDGASKHFKLVDGSSIVWTFGPDASINELLRFETLHSFAAVDLSALDENMAPKSLWENLIERKFEVRPERIDHFSGKVILKHNSGNCASILHGALEPMDRQWLFHSIAFPLGCTSTKSLFLVESPTGTVEELIEFLCDLVTGDPLNPETQVGYIHPNNLDYLQQAAAANRPRIQTYGGERLSRVQARPLLVVSQEDVPDFFGHEIPAYVLAVRSGASLEDAVATLNRYIDQVPRLAVCFRHFDSRQVEQDGLQVKAHTILIDKPTSKVIPFYHEGNDYLLKLLQPKLLVR